MIGAGCRRDRPSQSPQVNNLTTITSMVRRILPDSDFESDEEPGAQNKLPGSEQKSDELLRRTPPRSSPKEPPRSVRRIIRPTTVQPSDFGTYEYNSDIYTEESSLGSFIVYSDGEEELPSSREEVSGIFPTDPRIHRARIRNVIIHRT